MRGPRWAHAALVSVGLAIAVSNTACHEETTRESAAPDPKAAEAQTSVRARIEARKREHAQELERQRLADQAAPTIRLPLERLSTGHIVVPVTVEGKPPMSFILDTGASMTVITEGTVEFLGLDFSDNEEVQAAGAGGEASTKVRLGSFPDFQVGDRVYSDLMVAVMDLTHLEARMERPVHGVLGKNFLTKHDVEIDFAASTLVLHGTGSRAAEHPRELEGLRSTPFTTFSRSGLIRVEVSLNAGPPMAAVFDLGAGGSVLNWNAANAAGVTKSTRGVQQVDDALQGADKRTTAAMTYVFESLSVGDTRFESPRLLIADMAVFETMGVSDEPAMILGLDLIRGRRLLIDYTNQRIYLGASHRQGSDM